MKNRLSLIIPFVLAFVSLISLGLIYFQEESGSHAEIKRGAINEMKFQMSGLQNLLYNRLTEGNTQEALLSLSLAATYPNIRTLILVDQQHEVILSNRYSWKGMPADNISQYQPKVGAHVVQDGLVHLDFNPDEPNLLQGYFPLIIEYKKGGLDKRMGVLYLEYDDTLPQQKAHYTSLHQTANFALIMLLSVVLIASLLYIVVSKRIARLVKVAQRITEGDYTVRTEITGSDEIGQLARAIDQMAQETGLHANAQNDLIGRLARKQGLLAEAQQISQFGSWELNLLTNELEWSDEIYRIFDIDPKQFGASYDAFLDVIHPEDRDEVNRAYSESVRHRMPYEVTHRLLMKDGSVKWVIERGETHYDNTGKAIRSVGTVQDVTARIQFKMALISAENELNSILNAIPDLLFEIDLDGKFYAARAPREGMLLVPPEKVIGAYLRDILPPQAADICMDALLEANLYGYTSGQHYALNMPEGEKWFELSISRKSPPEGQVAPEVPHFIVLVRDITERKVAEFSLVENRQQHLDLINNAPIGIFHSTVEGRFLSVNPTLAFMLGYASPQELIESVTNIAQDLYVDPAKRAEIVTEIQHNPWGWTHVKNEYRRKDGGIAHADLSVRAVPDSNGHVSYLEGFINDTTERDAALAALLDKEAQYRFAVETSIDGFWMVDTEGKIIQANDAYVKMSGYTKEELLTKRVPDLEAKETPEETAAHIVEMMKTGHAKFESEHRRKDGSLFPVHVVTSYSKEHGGRIFAFITDLTERYRKDSMLMQQSRLATMGEMIGNIAHQWRQPINALGLILFDLEDASRHGECDTQYLSNAVATSRMLINKMSTTIDDFKNFFRTDNTPTHFRLDLVVQSSLEVMSATLKHHHIETELVNFNEQMAYGRANDFSQCIINLLANAKDAIEANKIERGKIVITLAEDDEAAIITVQDNGGGIPKHIIGKIFDPYFTTKADGIGIGLYMTHMSIEENMRGKISVTNVGQGACFTIRLPKQPSEEGA